MLLSKLIKNEFIKLFKKKSTYIILFITIAYIIFSNFMYKNNNYYSYGDYSASSISYYEEELKKLDPKNPSDFSLYVDTKTQVDLLGLMNRYGFASWQANIISEYLFSSTILPPLDILFLVAFLPLFSLFLILLLPFLFHFVHQI